MDFVSVATDICLNNYNTNNEKTRTPYIIDEQNRLVIDKNWWFRLTEQTKKLISDLILPFVLDNVKIPHIEQKDDRLTNLYKAYQSAYEYQHWYKHLRQPANVIIFPQSNLDDNEYEINLQDKIGKKYFLKNSATSGKNFVPVEPIIITKDLKKNIKTILLDERFSSRRNDDTHVVLVPWNNDINDRNEIRVFVYNYKIVAASQQIWWRCHNYSQNELEEIGHALLNYEWKNLYYPDCVVDGYVKDNKFHLIELNCFGDHSGAGSSLFNWIEDHDLLYGKKERPEFRFMSIININFSIEK